MTDMMTEGAPKPSPCNFNALPSHIAMKHDAAQAKVLKKINDALSENNKSMREAIYPLLHEITALLRNNDPNAVHDLEKALSHLDSNKINELYKSYRSAFLERMSDGAIQDGTIEDLLPDDLKEVSPYRLQKIEGQVKEWLENCKNFNNQKTQDLYLMIQIGVSLIAAFQNMQKDANQSQSYLVRNQRS